MKFKNVFCLFEQSGTFKNVFKELGFNAYDIDIDNQFNCVDYNIDIFKNIDNYFNGNDSIFDLISYDSLVLAFFPCVRFENQINLWFNGNCCSMKKWSNEKKVKYVLELEKSRSLLYSYFCKLILISYKKGFKLIIENPFSEQHYLRRYFPLLPSIIDYDRRKLGDIYKKPTMYYFINCYPENNLVSLDIPVLDSNRGLIYCNPGINRSLITPIYALNFIKKYIL